MFAESGELQHQAVWPIRRASRVATILTLLCLSLLADRVLAQQSPRLNPTGRELELQIPVEENGKQLGTLTMRIGTDDEISMESQSLVPLLTDRVLPELIERIEAKQPDARLSLEDLRSVGMGAQFDPSRLTLTLQVPAELRQIAVISLGRSADNRTITSHPEALSAFVNINAGWNSTSIRNDDPELPDFSDNSVAASLNGLARLAGPVLAWEASVREAEEPASGLAVRRDSTQLLIDLPSQSTRLSIGDLALNGNLFQAPVDVLGFGIGREFALSPGRNIRPTGRQQFSLTRPATVELITDDQVFRRLSLEPGTYDLQDLTLSPGSNEIELRIIDDTGAVETLSFTAVYDSQLLAEGEFDFAMSLGVLAESGGDRLRYRDDVPVASGFIRTAMTPSLTGGVNWQLSRIASQYGIELLRATPIGPVGLALSASLAEGDSGQAIALGYRNVVQRDSLGGSFGFDVQYRTERFNEGNPAEFLENDRFSDDLQDVRPKLVLNAGYSQSLGDRVRGSMSITRTKNYFEAESSSSVGLGLAGQLGAASRLNWSLLARYTTDTDEPDSFDVSLGFTYRLDQNNSILARSSSDDASIDLAYTRTVDLAHVGGYSTDLQLGNSENDDLDLTARFGYTGNRYRARLENEFVATDLSTGEQRNSLSAFVDTSLVIAGSSFAFGRTIGNSFAIVDRHPTLGKRTLRLNPDRDSEVARTSTFGSAVLPDLGLHTIRSLQYDVDDLPLGYDLGAGVFVLKPPLGAGYRLQVGSAATVTVVGVLVDAISGNPLALVAGKAQLRDDPEREPVEFFSNRIGKFAISGLAPGIYDLQLNTQPERSVELVIEEDQATLMRIDALPVP